MTRLPIVGVMGSGTYADLRAKHAGLLLARKGVHLLTGGGSGTMEAVSRAFAGSPNRKGLVIGVIPGFSEGAAPDGYPNPWVEIPICTHLPLRGARGSETLSRNHINILTSDIVIALAGGAGTRSEIQLAVGYGKPVIAYLERPDELPELPEGVPVSSDAAVIERFIDRALADLRQ